jgi:hypothetical protein
MRITCSRNVSLLFPRPSFHGDVGSVERRDLKGNDGSHSVCSGKAERQVRHRVDPHNTQHQKYMGGSSGETQAKAQGRLFVLSLVFVWLGNNPLEGWKKPKGTSEGRRGRVTWK